MSPHEFHEQQKQVCEAGLKFINVLCTAFTRADPKSVKKTVKLSIFFTLLGFTSLKAACKMLMKLTPGRHLWLSMHRGLVGED